MTQETATLTIDTKEPVKSRSKSELTVRGILSTLTPAPSYASLRSGDYKIVDVCGVSAGVERKKMLDLLSSFADVQKNGHTRWENQITRLPEDYDHCFVLMEGTWKLSVGASEFLNVGGRLRGWRLQSVQMALASLQVRGGIHVLWTPGPRESAATIQALLVRAGRKEGFDWPH